MTDAKSQARKKLTFLLAIIVVLGVFLMYFKFIYINSGNLLSGSEDILKKQTIEQKKQDQATMEKTASLVSAKDLAQCDSVDKIVNGVNYKTVCLNNIYYNMSADNLDYGACEKLVDMSIDDCQKRVMLLSLAKEKNLAVCDKVPAELRLSCPDAYWNFSAIDQKKPDLCAKTSSPEININCQNNVLISLASQKGSVIQCSLYDDKTVKADCENFLKGKDSCDLIKNRIIKDFCVRTR